MAPSPTTQNPVPTESASSSEGPRTSRRAFLAALAAGAGATAASGRVRAADQAVVQMGNNYFEPAGLYVEPGTTVRFELAAGVHTATAYPDRVPEGAAAFDSGVISEGAFEHTFDREGTYDYYCIPHETVGMVGRVVVGTPGGPAEDTPIPVGEVPDSQTIVQQGAVGGETGDSYGGMMGPGGMGRGGGDHMNPGAPAGGGPGVGGAGPGSGRDVPWLLYGPAGALGLLALPVAALYWLARNRRRGSKAAIETLRRRYARGEISREEFERRRERLGDRD